MRKKVYEEVSEGTGLAVQLAMYNLETGNYEIANQDIGRTFRKPAMLIAKGEEPSQEDLLKRYRIDFD